MGTLKKAIGSLKDQTSIGIARASGNIATDIEVLVVKATSHEDEPAEERYLREILGLTCYSRGYVTACIVLISRRIRKTRDYVVAIKCLILVHGVVKNGSQVFKDEVVCATGNSGFRLLNMSWFRDEAHSNSWDHSGFVRAYALYLDEMIEFLVSKKKKLSDSRNHEDGSREKEDDTANAGKILSRLHQLLRILDSFLGCRPVGATQNSRLVLTALYPVVRESFEFYEEVCSLLGKVTNQFPEMEYADCKKAFDAYVSAAKQIDELQGFYDLCKDIGVARSSEFPEVKRVTNKSLEKLAGFLRERAQGLGVMEGIKKERAIEYSKDEKDPDINEIKALPPPEDHTPLSPKADPMPKLLPAEQKTGDLINLRDEALSADDQGNKFAVALFNGTAASNVNGTWQTFSSGGGPEVTSAWQAPAAESGKADWELELVESASNLSKQRADLAGGFDPLLLNGMYDQGTVRQHVSATELSGGSASSTALPGLVGKGSSSTPVLALPAPDGTVHVVGHQDPFAASLTVPPPSYVQIADMEKKQNLLTQEQQLWQQYGKDGMQGQIGLNKISGMNYYGPGSNPMTLPYGMPSVAGMGQSGAYGSIENNRSKTRIRIKIRRARMRDLHLFDAEKIQLEASDRYRSDFESIK